ncbi:MAG: ABC transporter permease [Myxococcota bacterium]
MEALFDAAVRLSAPLLLAALGELVVERSGVVNIGVEGMMLSGAFAGFATAVATGSPLAGTAVAAGVGCAVGGVFAAFAVLRKADQIVVGLAVNLTALGATGLATRAFYAGATPTGPTVAVLPIPCLAAIPSIGPVLFEQTPFVTGALAAALVVSLWLSRTRGGLRLRAVGEAARAADAEGVDVDRVRFGALLFGGAMAGIAGAALSLDQSDTFTEGMTSGRGFIALAVVIFGRWSAGRVALAALFFGWATALQFRLQAQGVEIPYPLFLMFPYAVTIAVLGLASGGRRAPADLGQAYRREGA